MNFCQSSRKKVDTLHFDGQSRIFKEVTRILLILLFELNLPSKVFWQNFGLILTVPKQMYLPGYYKGTVDMFCFIKLREPAKLDESGQNLIIQAICIINP